MDKYELLKKGSQYLRECFYNYMAQHDEEEVAYAVAQQKEKDVCNAIAAFIELKISETDIMRMLNKFFDIDSISEAAELISMVRTHNKRNELKSYLLELGMDNNEIVDYFQVHSVRVQLLNDPKLQNMTVDKLKMYFDRH